MLQLLCVVGAFFFSRSLLSLIFFHVSCFWRLDLLAFLFLRQRRRGPVGILLSLCFGRFVFEISKSLSGIVSLFRIMLCKLLLSARFPGPVSVIT